MPVKSIRGVDIVYEILGDSGPWVTVAPGGRRSRTNDHTLAELIAEAGYRVLIHDRRNTGASGIGFQGKNSSYEHALDLITLLDELDTGPAYITGSGSSARMSLLLARHHPEAVKGLLLWRVTGGSYAAELLTHVYYGQYLDAVRRGGIEAVLATEHFTALVRANPANGETLRRIGAEAFAAAMTRWMTEFRAGCDYPVSGMSPSDMRAINAPAIVIPGNDLVHPAAAGRAAHRFLPNSMYQEVLIQPVVADADYAGWEHATATLAARFIDFLRGQERRSFGLR